MELTNFAQFMPGSLFGGETSATAPANSTSNPLTGLFSGFLGTSPVTPILAADTPALPSVVPQIEQLTPTNSAKKLEVTQGSVSGDFSFDSLAESYVTPLLEDTLGLDSGSLAAVQPYEFKFENFEGSLIVLDDQDTPLSDGEIKLSGDSLLTLFGIDPSATPDEVLKLAGVDIDSSDDQYDEIKKVLDKLDITDASSALGVLDDALLFGFTGESTLTVGENSTPLTLEYIRTDNFSDVEGGINTDPGVLKVSFDPAMIEGANNNSSWLEENSILDIEGEYGVYLKLEEVQQLVNYVDPEVGAELEPTIGFAKLFGLDPFLLGGGNIDLNATISPSLSS
ncbi:hypothetical protein [Lyngbya aestuarii]|uniref:hypothetical protein n=1 Tax=Lyngbya aestuarii TaxID=118322 RepID=UPI00403E14A6